MIDFVHFTQGEFIPLPLHSCHSLPKQLSFFSTLLPFPHFLPHSLQTIDPRLSGCHPPLLLICLTLSPLQHNLIHFPLLFLRYFLQYCMGNGKASSSTYCYTHPHPPFCGHHKKGATTAVCMYMASIPPHPLLVETKSILPLLPLSLTVFCVFLSIFYGRVIELAISHNSNKLIHFFPCTSRMRKL